MKLFWCMIFGHKPFSAKSEFIVFARPYKPFELVPIKVKYRKLIVCSRCDLVYSEEKTYIEKR